MSTGNTHSLDSIFFEHGKYSQNQSQLQRLCKAFKANRKLSTIDLIKHASLTDDTYLFSMLSLKLFETEKLDFFRGNKKNPIGAKRVPFCLSEILKKIIQ